MTDVLLVLCTCPNQAVAAELARGLVENRLAACVNILPEIRSIYRWNDELQQDEEALMLVKTSLSAYEQLEQWLQNAHPYEVPEVLALPIAAGFEKYLSWVVENTG